MTANSAAAAPVARPERREEQVHGRRQDDDGDHAHRRRRPATAPTRTCSTPRPARPRRRPAPAAPPGRTRPGRPRPARRRARASQPSAPMASAHGPTRRRSSPYQVEQDGRHQRHHADPEPARPPGVDHVGVPGRRATSSIQSSCAATGASDQGSDGQAEAGRQPRPADQPAPPGQQRPARQRPSSASTGERPDQPSRVARPAAERRKVGRVSRPAVAQGSRCRPSPNARASASALSPCCCRLRQVHVRGLVLRRVVDGGAVDVGGVQAGERPGVPKRGEVGVVRQDAGTPRRRSWWPPGRAPPLPYMLDDIGVAAVWSRT